MTYLLKRILKIIYTVRTVLGSVCHLVAVSFFSRTHKKKITKNEKAGQKNTYVSPNCPQISSSTSLFRVVSFPSSSYCEGPLMALIPERYLHSLSQNEFSIEVSWVERVNSGGLLSLGGAPCHTEAPSQRRPNCPPPLRRCQPSNCDPQSSSSIIPALLANKPFLMLGLPPSPSTADTA